MRATVDLPTICSPSASSSSASTSHTDSPEEPEDDQRLQRVRARDALAEHLALELQLADATDARALELHRSARRLHRRGLVAVAVDRAALAGALVAPAAEELGHLVLERL